MKMDIAKMDTIHFSCSNNISLFAKKLLNKEVKIIALQDNKGLCQISIKNGPQHLLLQLIC